MRINNKVLFSLSNMIRTFEVLLISVFLSRFLLDKNALGELLQIIFISSILVTLISGLPLSLNFFYGRYSESEKRALLFVKFFFMLTGIALIFCLLIFMLKGIIANSFQNEAFIKNIHVILSFFFIKLMNTIFPNYHYLTNKLHKYLILYVITTVTLVGCFVYDYFLGNFSIENILMQLLGIELLRLVINFVIINKNEIKFNLGAFDKQEFIYVLTITTGVVLGAFNLYIDKYLVATLLNPTEFVFYQNGAINLPFVNIITSSLFIALIPVFAELNVKHKIKELAFQTKMAIAKCTFFLIPILVYCFFEAIPLIKFLYGDDFEASGHVFKIYILRYALSVMAFSIFMGSIGLEKRSNFIIFISAVIGLALNSVLIPMYGIIGASWAIVIASLSTIAISFYYINKKLNLRISDYFPVRDYFRIIFFSVLLYIPFYFFNASIDLKWVVVISAMIYYMIVLLILNHKMKIFNTNRLLKKA